MGVRAVEGACLAVALLPLAAGCQAERAGPPGAPELRLAWTEPVRGLGDLRLVEPWLAVDPSDPDHLAGAAMSVGGSGGLETVALVSRDGGRSWKVGRDLETGRRLFPDGDPVLAVSPSGTPYLSTLQDGFAVWKAVDDTSWTRTGTVPGGTYDRQWIAFDASGGERHGRLYTAGKIYIQVVGFPAEDVAAFSWSDDGGETFRDPVLVLPDPSRGSLNIVSQLQVLADGSLVAPYHFIIWPSVSPPPPGSPAGLLDGEIAVLRSDDGRRWEEPVRVGRMRKWGHGSQERMLKGLGAGGLVVGPGPDGGERLHLVWLDIVDGWLQVMTAHSTDGGRSWSEPVRVSREGRDSNQGNPGIAVDGEGRVAVVWNDRRDDESERCFRSRVAVSEDGGRTFPAEKALSDVPVCMRGGRWMNGGDTQGIVGLPGGGFHLLWIGGSEDEVGFRLHSTRLLVR